MFVLFSCLSDVTSWIKELAFVKVILQKTGRKKKLKSISCFETHWLDKGEKMIMSGISPNK